MLSDFEDSIASQFDQKRAEHLTLRTADLLEAQAKKFKEGRRGRSHTFLSRFTGSGADSTLHVPLAHVQTEVLDRGFEENAEELRPMAPAPGTDAAARLNSERAPKSVEQAKDRPTRAGERLRKAAQETISQTSRSGSSTGRKQLPRPVRLPPPMPTVRLQTSDEALLRKNKSRPEQSDAEQKRRNEQREAAEREVIAMNAVSDIANAAVADLRRRQESVNEMGFKLKSTQQYI